MTTITFQLICALLGFLLPYQAFKVDRYVKSVSKFEIHDSNQIFNIGGMKFIPLTEDATNALATQSPSSIDSTGLLIDTSSFADLQNAAIIMGGIGYLLFEKRPRGSARSDLIDIRRSSISNANFGVYATVFIPRGTILGCYPGYLVNLDVLSTSNHYGTFSLSYFILYFML